ncbi:flagellar motor switch protein FliG [Clostridium grantii]|uniref:Flagellar motor switch protein FliG n=1 Tax=Clostridium grantii DSM 8605 TaxID=1121316 RepID=A0A1M5W7Y0_9CLOT|nr:flagellar motor switch protein FliG [Clostridium grantii]SHH83596.1 flagellar motor switch protein FliG [Clostridium grantii DSM 8605]
MNNKVSGLKKAAMLLIVLGTETSSDILKQLPNDVIEKLAKEIGKIDYVAIEDRKEIIEEFGKFIETSEQISSGGTKYAQDLLKKALGVQKAQEIIANMQNTKNRQTLPFDIARKIESAKLIKILAKEHAQTIAIVLCYLNFEKSAEILSGLPEEIQSDVADRIATMRSVSPIAIKKVERALEKKLMSGSFLENDTIGGVDTLVNILNSVTRTTEKNILDGINEKKPDLKDEIKAKLFTFEDIKLLDSNSIQKVLREVSIGEIALSIKGASEAVIDLMYKNISSRASAAVKEELEGMGPVKVSKVEEAQQKIVSTIRRLESEGEVIINRGGKSDVI